MLYNDFDIKVWKWIYVTQSFWHKGVKMDICYITILALRYPPFHVQNNYPSHGTINLNDIY
jgi:hypothetical protein